MDGTYGPLHVAVEGIFITAKVKLYDNETMSTLD